MRIVHVVPYYPPDHWGGIEIHVFELCKYSRNHLTSVIASKFRRSSQNFQEMPSGTTVHRFTSFEPPRIGSLFPRTYNPYIPFIGSKLDALGEFDILHVHGQEYFTSHAAVEYARRRTIPCVLTIHHTGQAFSAYSSVRAARNILERRYFRRTIEDATFTVAVSRGAAKYLSRYKPQKSALVHNAVDLERFAHEEKSEEHVLFVGRLEPLKAPEDFVQAASLILKQVKTRFLVVGSGSLKRYLEKLTHDMGLSHYIDFQEDLPYDELAKTVCRASVLVAPANAGYSLLEAGAAGKATVSVKSDWNEDTVGDGALYVDQGDIHGIAAAVIRLLKDKELASSLGQRANEFVKRNRDWRVVYPRIDKIYSELTS